MRQSIVLGLLLGLALMGSYASWSSGASSKKTDDVTVSVYSGTEEDLKSVRFTSKTLDIVLEHRTDDRGVYPWVTVTETVEKPVPPEPAPPVPEGSEPPPPPEPKTVTETTTSSFRGDKSADELWTAFAPLQAVRQFPAGAEPKITWEGDKAAKIVVERRSGPLELTIADEVTYGAKDRFVKSGEVVYLVKETTLRPLEFAKTRLFDRRLFPQEEKDLDKVTIKRAGDSRVYVQNNKADRTKAFWSAPGAEAEDTTATTWLGKVFKMKAQTYAEPDKLPTLTTLFEVNLEGNGENWSFEVATDGAVPDAEYYARSAWNRAVVKLNKTLAADAALDLDSVYGGQPVPGEPTPGAPAPGEPAPAPVP